MQVVQQDAGAEMSAGESIGQRLRRLRLEKGLSQRELAGPGVSYAYVSRIEGGQRRPSLRAIRVLARKLGISAQYLETGSMTTSEEDREIRLSDAELRLRLDVARNQIETHHIAVVIGTIRAGGPIRDAERADCVRLMMYVNDIGVVAPKERPNSRPVCMKGNIAFDDNRQIDKLALKAG